MLASKTMKGISFQNGVEYKVTVEGEAWQQGQPITGRLEVQVKNPGADASRARVILAVGSERKLKSKSEDAFEILGQADLVQAQEGFSFALSPTVRISDKAGSLYLLYGSPPSDSPADLQTLGRLRLNILPHHYLQDLIDLMRSEFRFALKKITAGKKDFVEVEFDPPASKEWAQLDHLVLKLKLEGPASKAEGTLLAYFSFHRAEVDGLKAGLSTKLTVRDVAREADLADLVHDFNDRLNKEAAEELVRDIIDEYQNAGWLA